MKRLSLILSLFAATTALWSSCKKNETKVSPPLPGNEALTTMILTATNTSDASDVHTAKWQQLDLTGATPPDTSMAALNLKKNASYNVTVQILDSLDDLTSEIKDRGNYHLICFDVSAGLGLTCSAADQDTNNPPLRIGLADLFTTADAGNGTVEVTLHHQPNVKTGDCAAGSTDLDCTFSVHIN